MVENKKKKLAAHRPKAKPKPKLSRELVKNKQIPIVGKIVKGGSGTSSKKDSFEVTNVTFNENDDSLSSREKKDIPTTGDELLKWTRERMSFCSEHDSLYSLGDESELSPTSKKSRSDKSRRSSNFKSIKKKRKSTRSSSERSTDEGSLYQHGPSPFEDEVMFQWRLKKEEQMNLIKKKTKSEVTFLEPAPNIQEQVSNVVEVKKSRRKTRKSIQEARREGQRLLELELEEQKQREESYQQAVKKQQQEEDEEILREQRNMATLKKIKMFEKERLDYIWEQFKKLEDVHYRTCEKIPLVTKCNQLTSFVKKWEHDIVDMNIAELGETCHTNLELLKKLEELGFYTSTNDTEKMAQWKWASEMLRNIQVEMLDWTLYDILKDFQKNLKIENLEYGQYEYKNNSFSLSIWLKLDWPISLPNPRKPPPPNTEIHLSEVDLYCILPQSLECHKKALICLYLPYDHLSDTSASFYPPPEPLLFTKDICESNHEDKLLKQKYAYESYLRAEYKEKLDKFKEKHPNDKYLVSFLLPNIPLNEEIPKVPVQHLEPSPQEYVDIFDDLQYDTCVRNMYLDMDQDELNLRENQIVGGLYNLRLVYHPPQPQPLVKFYMTMKTVFPPKKLEDVEFCSKFQPPPLPWMEETQEDSASKTFRTLRGKRLTARYASKGDHNKKGGAFDPQEVQKYKDAQELWEQSVQQEKEKMIFISLRLPENVIYLERPSVNLWDEKSRVWTAADIYDVDYEHEGRRVTFRSSRFGLIGLSVRKFSNYPYKSWDIRPELNDSISVVLEGMKVTIKLSIRESEIKIVDFEYRLSQYLVGSEGLNYLKNESMSLPKFMQTMNASGLDMFPEYDASSYYTATMEKHWGMAYVTYYAMAQNAIRYNFCNSKWNQDTGRRSIVLRLREFDPHDVVNILRPFDLVQSTPMRCQVLACTEEDDDFSDESYGLYKFQPNLQYLLKSMSKATNRVKIKEFSPITIHTLAQFLIRTRIFSFS